MSNLILGKLLQKIPVNVLTAKSERSTHLAEKDDGFSLLEIVVVVLMIGILSAIAAPGWLGFVNRQKANKANDVILSAIQQAQREAKKQKLSYSVSFRNDNNTPEVAIYRAKNPDGTNATPPASSWKSLLAELGTNGQLVIGTNIPTNENSADTTVSYTSTTISTNKPQTITFDYMGALDLTVKTNITSVQDAKITNKGLIVAVAVAQPGDPTQASDLKRCVIVKTLLGSLKTAKDSACE